MRALRLINPETEFRRYRRRLGFTAAVALILFLVLLGRSFWLQVIQYDHFHALAENNRIALVPAPPPRGSIYDREGVVLAQNYSAYTLEITPSETGGLKKTLDALAKVVKITPLDLRRFNKLLAESKSFESVPIRTRLTEEEVARFAVNRYRFPGVEVRARLFRQYPFGETFSHVVGYIGRINQKDLNRLDESGQGPNYRGSDHIGKAGIEARYEYWLHGKTGIEKVENDSSGRAVRTLSRQPPVAGYGIQLNIDAKLQQVAEQVFGDYKGALVALDPRDGSVLAMISRPGFDPNLFVDGIDVASWKELNDSPDRPLINRALRGLYPPGSTIKPFMALAGLELGVRRPDETIVDPGYYTLPGSSHRYRDWKWGGHGLVDLQKSIIVSCDTYYYGLAHLMGINNMYRFLSQFGFGHKTGIDLDGELQGLLPNPAWKMKHLHQPWWPGETVIAGIGQGYTLVTPLQLAVATMGIANGGVIYRPRLLRDWIDPITGEKRYALPQVEHRIALDPRYVKLVREAMVDVTRPGGTAARAGAGAAYSFAGKTGTAQVVGIKRGAGRNERKLAKKYRDHALFIGFAPADDPKIVVAVLVENGGHGGSTAAPIARKVFDYWLLGKLPAVSPPVAPTEEAPGEEEDSTPADEDVPDTPAGPTPEPEAPQ